MRRHSNWYRQVSSALSAAYANKKYLKFANIVQIREFAAKKRASRSTLNCIYLSRILSMDQVEQSKVTEEPRATYHMPHDASCRGMQTDVRKVR